MTHLRTVTGFIDPETITLADGHGHVWIEPPQGVAGDVRIELNDYAAIEGELRDFHAQGSALIVDCQPGGAGRDARQLAKLSNAAGVAITATTGFHQQKYYPPASWLWHSSAEPAAAFFIEELTVGTFESGGTIPATVIKVGYEGIIDGQTRILMEAAAEASNRTGAAILFHTERGLNIEALLPFFTGHGVPCHRLYLCHVDKRPDFGLHRELAQAGVLLGYDTFVRPKYNPNQNVWPLVKQMAAAGLDGSVAVCLDLAFPYMWRACNGAPGLLALVDIVSRLRAEGMSESSIRHLTALNVVRRLVWADSERTSKPYGSF